MKTEPLKYQLPVLDRINKMSCFALFMEYGTGKSYCVLWWLDQNKERYKNKVLIVGKKTNILKGGAWPAEIEKHTDFSYTILKGSRSQKTLNLKKDDSDIFLINYSSVRKLIKEIKAKNFSTVIFDESTEIKNLSADITKQVIKLVPHIQHRIIMTGFPVSEKLNEIWSQFFVVDLGEKLSPSYWRFMNRHFKKWRFGWTLKKGHDEKILNKIKDKSVFLRLRDCIDLPPRIYRYIAVQPTARQKRYIEELKNDFALTISPTEQIEYIHILPILVKLQQICSGFIYLSDKRIEKFETKKTQVILSLLKEIPDKKIIWCKHTEEVKYLRHLVSNHIDSNQSVVDLSSYNSEAQNNSNLIEFKSKQNCNTLITTFQFLESGETLTMCNYNILYSHIWSNNITSNAKARTYRKGSEVHSKIVYIHIYTQNTIEEVILETLRKKKNVQRKLKNYMENWVKT